MATGSRGQYKGWFKGRCWSQRAIQGIVTAIATMSRWKSFKLVAFSAEENSSSISNEDGLALQVSGPLSSLESFIMLGPCLSSPSIDKPLSTISTSSKGRLRPTQVSCPSIISRIARHSLYGYSDLSTNLGSHLLRE